MKTLLSVVLIASVAMLIAVEAKEDPPEKNADGDNCSTSDECTNGLCDVDGKCANPCVPKEKGKNDGESCTEGKECKSRICTDEKKCGAAPACPEE